MASSYTTNNIVVKIISVNCVRSESIFVYLSHRRATILIAHFFQLLISFIILYVRPFFFLYQSKIYYSAKRWSQIIHSYQMDIYRRSYDIVAGVHVCVCAPAKFQQHFNGQNQQITCYILPMFGCWRDSYALVSFWSKRCQIRENVNSFRLSGSGIRNRASAKHFFWRVVTNN